MQRVSFKTLALMLLLLAAVVAHQHVRCVPCACAGTIWLASDGTDPNDPGDPGPESCFRGPRPVWLDEAPPDANDPDDSTEPMPESVGRMPMPFLPVVDPNDPGPEYT